MGNEPVVARGRAAGFSVVGAIAAAIVLSAGVTVSHRQADLLEQSVVRLEQAREACVEAQTEMRQAYAWAEGRTASSAEVQASAALEDLQTVMGDADRTAGVCDAAATSDPGSNDLLTAKFQEAADDANGLEATLVSARTDVEREDAEAALAEAKEDFDDARGALEDALAEGSDLLQETTERVADGDTRTTLRELLGEGSTAAALEPGAEAGATWYASQAEALSAATAQVSAAMLAVEAAHNTWLDSQAQESVSVSTLTVKVRVDGSEGDFCDGLDAARVAGGLAPFASCTVSSSLVAHAEDMAVAGDIWHSGYDNIVGYASTVPRLVEVFMDSPTHHALIMTAGDSVDATVGCAWRKVSGTNAAGATVNTSLVFCTAAFES